MVTNLSFIVNADMPIMDFANRKEDKLKKIGITPVLNRMLEKNWRYPSIKFELHGIFSGFYGSRVHPNF